MREYFIWLFKFLTVILVFFFVVPAFIIATIITVSSKNLGKDNIIPQDKNMIAVVELNGIIMESKDTVDKLNKFAFDDKFKGIILKVNSPGGAVAPSQDIYNTVLELKNKKPIYAVMESMAASGGYYISSACSKIYAQKGTMTASIGVISQFMNVKSLMEWFGVKTEVIKSGKLKDFGSMYRDMTDEERAYWEEMSNSIHEDFIQDVAKARNLDINKLREVSDGRVLTGSAAKKVKLIDEIGGVNNAAKAMFDELKIKLDKNEQPKLYYSEDKLKEFKKFLNSSLSFLSRSQQGVQIMYLN